jgi:hypothetical protein
MSTVVVSLLSGRYVMQREATILYGTWNVTLTVRTGIPIASKREIKRKRRTITKVQVKVHDEVAYQRR